MQLFTDASLDPELADSVTAVRVVRSEPQAVQCSARFTAAGLSCLPGASCCVHIQTLC